MSSISEKLDDDLEIHHIKGNIDYDQFEAIALEQIGLSTWEFDYWLGENS